MSEPALAEAGTKVVDAARQRAHERRQQALIKTFGAEFAKRFTMPYIVLEGEVLRSPTAIRFYRKDFSYLSEQLVLEYQYRGWRGFNTELVGKFGDLTSQKLSNIKTLMQNTINRIKNLIQGRGMQDVELTLWPSEFVADVPVIATHARTYLEILQMLDEVYTICGTANLLGVIDSTQRTNAEFTCKKAIRAFRSIVQMEVAKLYREADRVVREQHSGGGEVDEARRELVSKQGQDIAEFDKVIQADEDADPAMSLNGADPGQVIDDSAAASTAAAAASAPKKRARPKAAEGAGPGSTETPAATATS
ncbi:hypothetical protein FN976_11260 [Caenimonas sedimenti]|uniref:DUF1845 domain-containing protein n=1 Tax=Caenimonas sedimenti TaxID=2596921 RepID=A0A562ZT72_9BURK|nr:hypothetical protein [Caenimonas sedimenti]TWO71485.1 hypothetical protein FN976_11260 [Caenimonas sedimenti]